MILATLTDLREIKLPWVGDVTLSFVPVLACLIALGLWPAMAVAAVSGITAAWVTRDPVEDRLQRRQLRRCPRTSPGCCTWR